MMRSIFLLLILLQSFINADELKKVVLQLQWKHQFQFAGYYIAEEKGFYKEAGFDVKIRELENNIDIPKEVLKEHIDYAVGRSSLIINRSKGDKIALLASILQSSPHVLLTTKNTGIKNINDLMNKKVMFAGNEKDEVTLKSMLFSKGIDENTLKVLPLSFNVDDLINGTTDLISAYVSNEPFLLKEKGYDSIIFDPKDYGFDFYNDILFTSQKNIEKNYNEVERFREASLKGWEYAFENIEETVTLILKKYNTQKKSKDALIFEAKELKKLAYYNTDKLGNIDKTKIEKIFYYYKLMGFTKDYLDMNKFVFQKDNDNLFDKTLFTKDELKWIKNHPTIKVSNELDYPPFDFAIKGLPKGFSIDLINLLSKYINIQVEYINGYTWNELQEMFKKGELDLLHSLTRTKQREALGIFSEPFIRYKTYIFTTRQNSHIKKIEQLFGKTIVVGKGWSIEKYLEKNYPQINLLKVDNVQQMLLAVSKGKADALINDKYSTLYDIKKFDIENIVQSNWFKEFDNNEFKSYHFLAQKNAPELISILNKALSTIPQSEIEKLKIKWFNESVNKSSINLTSKEKEYLENKKSISMCIDPNWMPFESFDEKGNHIGMSADYYELFKKRLNVDFKLVKTTTWDKTLTFAKNRTCDIISLAMETPNRKKYLNFTSPYLKVPLVIATLPDAPFIYDLNDIKHKKIAIPKGYAFVELLKHKYPQINIIEVKNIDEGLKLVSEGKMYGYIDALTAIGYKVQNEFLGEIKVTGKVDDKWELGIAVRNDDLVLLNILNKLINTISKEEHSNILNKWVSIKYEKGIDYLIIWEIIVGFTFILILVLLFMKKIHQQKKEFESIFKFSQDGIAITDLNTQFLEFNDSFIKLIGYSKDELLKKQCLELVLNDNIDEIKRKLDIVKKENHVKNFEIVCIKKDGSSIFVNMSISLLPDKKRLLLVSKDVSSLKLLEEQSKLASMGEMIGNIAHQWRQPLSVISITASGLKLDVEMNQEVSNEKVLEFSDIISEQSKYLSQTIDDFRDFANNETKYEEVKICKVIKESINLVKDSIKKNFIKLENSIYCEKECDRKIVLPKQQIIQVIINIIINSKDIIVDRKIENGLIKIDHQFKEKSIIITIEDNGGGIPIDILPRVFEPYFTTKHQSQGTGLGLHLSYKIIDGLKGKLYVKNTSIGAKFYIELPLDI